MSVYRIYKEGDEDNFYIGSTNNFNGRKYCHKIRCKTRNHKLYNYINENGGWECFKMEVIEYCLEYQEREIELIKQLQPPLNSYLYNFNSKEFDRKYREENKDKIKKYREENKDKIKKYREENKEYIKQKRQIKSEEHKEYMKKYREENKEELYKKANEKITCECGCIVSKRNITKHRKSKKHIELIK